MPLRTPARLRAVIRHVRRYGQRDPIVQRESIRQWCRRRARQVYQNVRNPDMGFNLLRSIGCIYPRGDWRRALALAEEDWEANQLALDARLIRDNRRRGLL